MIHNSKTDNTKQNEDSAGTPPTSHSDPALGAKPRMQRVMVVDDEETLVIAVGMLLEQAGYEVFSATNCDQAKVILADQSIDVVITDLAMPGEDGFTLLAHIKELDQKLPRRVYAATGNVSPGIKEEVLSAGFDGLVTKPYWIEEIFRLLRHT